MSDQEKDPSRGREQNSYPKVEIIADPKFIEEMTWRFDDDMPMLVWQNETSPIDVLRLAVDGSSSPDGPFTFRSTVQLQPGHDYEDLSASFFYNFAAEKDAFSTDERNLTYLMHGEDGYSYLFYASEDYSVITLESAGHTTAEEDLVEREIGQLRHGKDNFEEALDDYFVISVDMLQELHAHYGRLNLKLDLEIQTPESSGAKQVPSNALAPVEAPKPSPQIRLSDLGGLDEIKQMLLDTALMLRHPEILAEYNVERPHGIFLYGPPGTGKTSLAKALATELDADLQIIKSSDIYGKWMGASEGNLQAILDEAAKTDKPLVLLFDEIDGVIRRGGGSAYDTVATLFKQSIGELSERNPNVVVMATSNKAPEDIDEAFFRDGRFDIKLYVPMPDQATREAIFGTLVQAYFQNTQEIFDITEIDFAKLGEASQDMSGATISAVVRKLVGSRAIAEIRAKKAKRPFAPELFKTRDIIKALASHRQRTA